MTIHQERVEELIREIHAIRDNLRDNPNMRGKYRISVKRGLKLRLDELKRIRGELE